MLGLAPFDGALTVLGLDPRTQRDALMHEVSFIADVAILSRWLKVKNAIDFVEGVYPKFNRGKCEAYIANTKLTPNMKVSAMSKGVVVQLHLALVMAIDTKLLVLDEPTLGLAACRTMAKSAQNPPALPIFHPFLSQYARY